MHRWAGNKAIVWGCNRKSPEPSATPQLEPSSPRRGEPGANGNVGSRRLPPFFGIWNRSDTRLPILQKVSVKPIPRARQFTLLLRNQSFKLSAGNPAVSMQFLSFATEGCAPPPARPVKPREFFRAIAGSPADLIRLSQKTHFDWPVGQN